MDNNVKEYKIKFNKKNNDESDNENKTHKISKKKILI